VKQNKTYPLLVFLC